MKGREDEGMHGRHGERGGREKGGRSEGEESFDRKKKN